jgi:ATP-dependent DNA helicase DinG
MIFMDTETTGLIKNAALPLSQQPRMIEICCCKIEREDLHDVKTFGHRPGRSADTRTKWFQTIFQPKVKLEPIITKITGLTDDDLEDAPEFYEEVDALAEFFLGETEIVCHNIEFDMQILQFELQREKREFTFPWPVKRTDTVQMAMPYYNGRYKKLDALYHDLIGPREQTHRATDDVEMLIEVYNALIAKKVA